MHDVRENEMGHHTSISYEVESLFYHVEPYAFPCNFMEI